MNKALTLSVVMPAYNEAATVDHVIRRVLAHAPVPFELIIVDDGSTDGTTAVLERWAGNDSRIRLIRQENAGKSAALRRGFEASRGSIVIVQDADLEYDPAEIAHVIRPILENDADVVYGSRFLVRRASRVLYFWHYLANRFLTLISNVMTNLNMTDIETGYKAFRGDIIRSMVIEATGFGFEVEVTAKLAKLGAVIYEVPISYFGRTYEEGKKIGVKDGLAALWYLIRFNLFVGVARSFRARPPVGIRASTDPQTRAASASARFDESAPGSSARP
jgi:glycosyltransferase involved in cell wall biosynthesis